MATYTPTAKALIYVPDFNATAFRDDCKAHGVKITLIKISYFDYYVDGCCSNILYNNTPIHTMDELIEFSESEA